MTQGDRDGGAKWLMKEWQPGRRDRKVMTEAAGCTEGPSCHSEGGGSWYEDPSQKHQVGQTQLKQDYRK